MSGLSPLPARGSPEYLHLVSRRPVPPDVDEAVRKVLDFANDFAPEHLMLAVREAQHRLPMVSSAGSVFLGSYAAAAAGDYATGANYVLPTGGGARSFGPLGVRSFGRMIQVQQIERQGVPSVADLTDVLAEVEQLPWHAASVRSRLS